MKIIECPRDAMQGMKEFIPTEKKRAYLEKLLKVGFDTLDCGSFVSPSAVPQMKDTADVLSNLDMGDSNTKLLCIVANKRGAEEAIKFENITYLGYPFSISETFQMRNTNAGIEDSLKTLAYIQNLCIQNNKEAVVYISMGFGNPYGDPWSLELVKHWVGEIASMGIGIISLADTVGLSEVPDIRNLFASLIPDFPKVEFGAHLHSRPDTWEEKLIAAYDHGCRRFDSAMRGYGGCPFANDELTGNIATENVLRFMEDRNIQHSLNQKAFSDSLIYSGEIFH